MEANTVNIASTPQGMFGLLDPTDAGFISYHSFAMRQTEVILGRLLDHEIRARATRVLKALS